jgi:hypothetical protein
MEYENMNQNKEKLAQLRRLVISLTLEKIFNLIFETLNNSGISLN